MNKIILSLIILSTMVVAGEQEGTGEPSNSAATNETIYQLVCTPVNSTQQDNSQYCVLVPVLTND
jgi:hypothetical protein